MRPKITNTSVCVVFKIISQLGDTAPFKVNLLSILILARDHQLPPYNTGHFTDINLAISHKEYNQLICKATFLYQQTIFTTLSFFCNYQNPSVLFFLPSVKLTRLNSLQKIPYFSQGSVNCSVLARRRDAGGARRRERNFRVRSRASLALLSLGITIKIRRNCGCCYRENGL